MTKRIEKKHKAIAAEVHENAFSGNTKKPKYYTWRRTNSIMHLMHIYYDLHYYHEEDDTRADKFCFW